MEAQRWLRQNAPGYENLTPGERKAIRDFALLWSYFESLVLNTAANADSIRRVCTTLHTRGRLQLNDYAKPLTYFRHRYFDGTSFTPAFAGLHLRRNDKPALVERVLRGEATSVSDTLAGLLIIVLRLRNNLFHGVKWSYGIRGQRENFTHANMVLMTILTAYLP
ncbi:MAG: hypothetical protein KGJ78_16650 [Alphaproteobacteria bacterium]|nr:hypothetical protein [Alphaproteobacteria bacterium]